MFRGTDPSEIAVGQDGRPEVHLADNWLAWSALGMAEYGRHRLDDAIAALNRAVGLNPTSGETLAPLAECYPLGGTAGDGTGVDRPGAESESTTLRGHIRPPLMAQ